MNNITCFIIHFLKKVLNHPLELIMRQELKNVIYFIINSQIVENNLLLELLKIQEVILMLNLSNRNK